VAGFLYIQSRFDQPTVRENRTKKIPDAFKKSQKKKRFPNGFGPAEKKGTPNLHLLDLRKKNRRTRCRTVGIVDITGGLLEGKKWDGRGVFNFDLVRGGRDEFCGEMPRKKVGGWRSKLLHVLENGRN